jgi:hypothetical protein
MIHAALAPQSSVDWSRFCRAAFVCLVAVAGSSCNTREPVFQDLPTPTAPSAPPPGLPVPAPVSTLVGLSLDPSGLMSGGTSTGSVLLSLPAPAGGMNVRLASGDSSVTVPASVTVPGGADTAQFPIGTQVLSSDRQVPVVAQAEERSVQAQLALWTVRPTFFAFSRSSTDPRTTPTSGLLTPDTERFTVFCNDSRVEVGITSSRTSWNLSLGAPRGTALHVGTYENAQAGLPNSVVGPLLNVGCSPGSGRFTVNEVELVGDRPRTVIRFSAHFESQCSNGLTTRGEIRLTDVPASTTTSPPCLIR